MDLPLNYHQETYTVRTYEIDHQKRMNIPALGRLMQEAAMQQVLQLQLSVWDLESEQVAWVLMRLQLEIKRLPILEEKITIKTTPTGLERIFTYRGFWVYDAKDQLIAQATTQWVLMDTVRRKLRTIPDWIKERFAEILPPHPTARPKQKLPEFKQADYQSEFRVRWHDLDFNLHLNNTYYILYLLEGLPADFLTKNILTQLNIQYKEEVRQEETFQILVQQLAPRRFLHRMVQGTELRVVAEMETVWE
jgi:medium-chain acyl-[acyl-carrier-protein] hydrolase